MPALIVPCPHCSHPSKLDTDRLPDHPVSYACPRCKQKVVVDKRVLLQQQAAQQTAASQPAVRDNGPSTAVPLPSPTTTDRRFNRLPAGARFPTGIIVGDDDAVIEEIRAKLAAAGSDVERVESTEDARHMILSESPELCIVVGTGEIAPPYEPMQALTGLPPSVRRRIYLVLVADNLKTLDGTAAFTHQVNMVLSKQDLGQFEAALYSGIDYHGRLYRPYFQAAEHKNSV